MKNQPIHSGERLESLQDVAPASFPHHVSCEGCRALLICNGCGGPAPKSTRCTNGHCPKCCKPAHHPNTP